MNIEQAKAFVAHEYHFRLVDALQPKPTAEMVGRFLAWPLPKDFAPDAGIDFKEGATWPSGTNLLNYPQAKDMLTAVMAPSEPLPDSFGLESANVCVLVMKGGFHAIGIGYGPLAGELVKVGQDAARNNALMQAVSHLGKFEILESLKRQATAS